MVSLIEKIGYLVVLIDKLEIWKVLMSVNSLLIMNP